MSKQHAVTSVEAKTIDLMPFCDPEEGTRYPFQKPWQDGGRVVATDGRMMIVCDPALYTGELTDATKHRLPKVQDIIKTVYSVVRWSLLPKFPECTTCDGTGELTKTCPHCRGAGEHRCECGHEHDCDYCEENGETTEQCEACDVKFGNRRVARRLANKLLPLPQTEWGVASTSASDPVFFRFTGGIGVVMPLRK